MSEAKFSNGQWEIDEVCWDEGSWSINMAHNGTIHYAAATVVTCMEGGENNKKERERLEANAHLIKAAPKMYQFIEGLQLCVGDQIKAEKLLAEARGE